MSDILRRKETKNYVFGNVFGRRYGIPLSLEGC